MSRSRRIALLSLLGALGAVSVALLLRPSHSITLTGAVIRGDSDPGEQAPIAEVDITATDGLALHGAKSDSSGFFQLTLRPGIKPGQPVTLKLEHPGYQPLVLTQPAGGRLYVARMSPLSSSGRLARKGPPVSIAQVTVRYTLRQMTTVNVGSAVKTFDVANSGNIPCGGQSPCSPDGKWKAATASVSLDAGEGNQFQGPRVTCIAGPCPFTRIDADQLSQAGRIIKVSVLNWSDTTRFLLQAEVVRSQSENVARRLYPEIFGKDLDFILPAEAQGPSLEAEVDGAAVLFPLPDLCLSWADCQVQVNRDQTRIYRCELKPGYEFR